MAIIPASRGVVFYDPTHRLYQTSYQANANLTDFSYTMQDIIDTVTNSVVENTSAVANYIIPVNRNSEASRALSETVKEGEVVLIFPVTAFSSNNSSYYNFTAFANIQDPIIPGLGLTVQHPPIIINKTNGHAIKILEQVYNHDKTKDSIS